MMRATILLILSTTALAFNLRFYENSDDQVCKDEVTDLIIRDPKLSDGCHKLDPKLRAKWMVVDWTKEEDNDLIVQFFEDEHCCNGQTSDNDIRTGWSDQCLYVDKFWYNSWRIVDADDTNKGKDGEKYDCEK